MKTLEEKRAYNREQMRKWHQTEKGRKHRYVRRQEYYERTAHLSDGTRRKWTDDEKDILRSWTKSDEELAHVLGRSVHAIQGMRHMMKKGLR